VHCGSNEREKGMKITGEREQEQEKEEEGETDRETERERRHDIIHCRYGVVVATRYRETHSAWNRQTERVRKRQGEGESEKEKRRGRESALARGMCV